MASERILITGATGNMGLETIRELTKHPDKTQFEILAGVRNLDKSKVILGSLPNSYVPLDFSDTSTFVTALTGVSRVLLVRPPELADVDTYFRPFIDAMKSAGVRHVTFLSLQGVENNSITPHHKIEKLIVEAGLEFTFLRPSFFMQNLSTTHRDEIRLHNEIFIPAGKGRTSFVDVRDVAAVAAQTLTSHTSQYFNRGYELTGSEALTYCEIAQILTKILGRDITYRNPSIVRFIWQKWQKEHLPLGFTLIMTTLYTVSKLGKASRTTNELEQLLGRAPITFQRFAADYRTAWLP